MNVSHKHAAVHHALTYHYVIFVQQNCSTLKVNLMLGLIFLHKSLPPVVARVLCCVPAEKNRNCQNNLLSEWVEPR